MALPCSLPACTSSVCLPSCSPAPEAYACHATHLHLQHVLVVLLLQRRQLLLRALELQGQRVPLPLHMLNAITTS